MIVEAAMFVVYDDEQRLLPLLRIADQRVIDIQDELLTVADISGRMIVVGGKHASGVDKNRIDPTDARQGPVGRLLVEIVQVIVAEGAVLAIGQIKRRAKEVVAIPAPSDLPRVEVTDEGRRL